jgi:hypothetical protein
MIVTKALAEKYLIKKHCYLIEPEPDGDYRIVSTSVHWKEGMEVFETMEECAAEIDRRQNKKMDAGNCPRCEYKNLTETERDITKLDLLQQVKSGALYRCGACGTVWHKATQLPKARAYDVSIADYILEWAERNLKPAKEMTGVLHGIKDISNDKTYLLFPAHVILKNGFEFPYALIKLERQPPPARWFEKSDWFYLDQVVEIKPSPYAYAYTIAKHIRTSPQEFIFIKDLSDNQIYRFVAHAGVFMPEEFVGKTFQLMDSKKVNWSESKPVMEQDYNERGGPDHWNFTPPKEPTWFCGDL